MVDERLDEEKGLDCVATTDTMIMINKLRMTTEIKILMPTSIFGLILKI